MTSAFFTIHSGLDREGPGSPEDVAWVAQTIALPPDARICDAACGPGADVQALLSAAPKGHVTAIDAHKPFIDELYGRIGADPRVTAFAGNIKKLKGPLDLIWCAGAVYFLGIKKALKAWRPCLAPGGAIAFSEPCFFVDNPSEAAKLFWEDYETTDEAGIRAQIAAAGYRVIDVRRISDAGWEAYYRSLEQRVAQLRADANEELSVMLDLSQQEADMWRKVRDETGYLLAIVRPV